jgi:hypothetical protein
MHHSGELLSHLRLRKPHRLRGLERGGDGPQLLQKRNPVNPNRVGGRRTRSHGCIKFVR